MSYEIRIVPDEDFDKLPYAHAKDAFGLADARRGVAFVRLTGVRDLDNNTINHEFDELLQKVSPHEEDGIRYKKGGFGKIFRPVLSALSWIPSPVQPFARAASLATTAFDISKRGFKPTDLLQLAPAGLGALKGAGQAGGNILNRFGGALKGSVGLQKGPDDFKLGGGRYKPDVPSFQGTSSFNQSSGVLDAFKSAGTDVAKQLTTGAIVNRLAPAGQQPLSSVGPVRSGTSLPTRAESGALSRFSPELTNPTANRENFITDDDVQKAFSRIDETISTRTRSAKQQFRGRSRAGNTAFNQLLNRIATSRDLERNQFLQEADQENTSRYQGAVKNDLMRLNNISEEQFNQYLEMARQPGASPNLKEVFSAFLT